MDEFINCCAIMLICSNIHCTTGPGNIGAYGQSFYYNNTEIFEIRQDWFGYSIYMKNLKKYKNSNIYKAKNIRQIESAVISMAKSVNIPTQFCNDSTVFSKIDSVFQSLLTKKNAIK